MVYEVIARKWRPQQFDDVVGQEHVVRTLRNAIENERIAQAYLFVGPRGIGKTTSARIFAKALNCEQGPTVTPCDKCDSCCEVMNGQGLDVIEIDGASNNSVDQVRDLRQNAQFSAARGKFKIYIIDEVHMLSSSAFNALLKILEEPPPHVKFLLATTEAHKIPATILSRCQRFDLRRIATADIVERLREIAADEKLTIEENALLAIARGAEGGLRDAESALDQLIAFQGSNLVEADVLSVFGLVSWDSLRDLVGAVLAGDIQSLIALVNGFDEQGKDMQRLLLELLEHVRDLLVLCHDPEGSSLRDRTEAQRGDLAEQVKQTDPSRLLQMMQILSDAEPQIRHSLSRRTLMETTLIRCARAANLVPMGRIIRELRELREQIGAGLSPAEPSAAQGPAPSTPQPVPSGRATHSKKSSPAPAETIGDPGEECGRLRDAWDHILDKVGQMAPLVRNSLRDAAPVRVEQNRVVIGFDPEFKISLDNVVGSRSGEKATQTAISELLGRKVNITFQMLDASATLPGDTKIPEPKKKETIVEAEPEAGLPLTEVPRELTPDTVQILAGDPAVRMTLEAFEGQIEDIRH